MKGAFNTFLDYQNFKQIYIYSEFEGCKHTKKKMALKLKL